jgi:riboflavin kinase / FMN adenylyltransferase
VCEALGIDYLFVIEFSTQVAALSHQQFVNDFLLPLNVKLVVAGDDNRYGQGGQGTVHTIGPDSNHQIEAIEFHERALHGVRVASSLIRKHLRAGQMEAATELLGRPYKVSGRVVYGKGRGKLIGVPTANIALKYPYLIPLGGVYLVRFYVQDQSYYGVCNIGYNPTFGAGNERTIEVHVLDFDGNLYDSFVEVEFFSRIRDEMKFASADALVTQIQLDIETARARILALQSS